MSLLIAALLAAVALLYQGAPPSGMSYQEYAAVASHMAGLSLDHTRPIRVLVGFVVALLVFCTNRREVSLRVCERMHIRVGFHV